MLNKIYGYLVLFGGAVLALLAALGMARRSGTKAAQQAQTETALKQAKESSEIDAKIHRSSDTDIADKLSKYQRD